MYAEEYLSYIESDKKKSANTIEAYKRDLSDFLRYVKNENIDICNASETDIAGYLLMLKQNGKTGTTISRKLSGIRNFYAFLEEKGYLVQNPAKKISAPKTEKKAVEYLTVDEVTKLLDFEGKDRFEVRDKAILELMYATGMRVSELIEAKLEDINYTMGFMTFSGNHGQARIVPVGRSAREAVMKYLDGSRKLFLKGDDSGVLFLSYRGTPLTRQGLWKILKRYGEAADIGDIMTPHILRSSFAVHMAQNGADIRSLQELMGHEDIAATQVYMSVARPKIKEVYDRTHPRAL